MDRTKLRKRRARMGVAVAVAASTALGAAGVHAKVKAKPAAAPVPLTLTAKEFSFDPSTPSVAGKRVRITFTNSGTVDHNLTIKSLRVNRDLKAGKSITVVVTVKAGGSYPFYCEYHQAKGMTGTLKVA